MGGAVLPVPREQLARAAAGNGQVTVGFRPEAMHLVGPGEGVPVLVNVVEQLGSDAFLYTKLAGEDTDDVLHPSDVVIRTEPRSVRRGRARSSGSACARAACTSSTPSPQQRVA